jgi:hypothetical protein
MMNHNFNGEMVYCKVAMSRGAHCHGLFAHELVGFASSCFDGSMTPIQMLCISMQRLLLSFYVTVSPTL